MTSPSLFDHYLMGHLASEHRVPPSALRIAIAIDAECSPFQVQLTPLKECGPSVLYRVTLPRAARATAVTDIWPMGRLSIVSDLEERRRLVSVTTSVWPLLCRPDTRAEVTTIRLGDPVLYAFQLRPLQRAARVFSSAVIGALQRPPRHPPPSYAWARDWLASTLEKGGWRVIHTDAPSRARDIDWAIGQ